MSSPSDHTQLIRMMRDYSEFVNSPGTRNSIDEVYRTKSFPQPNFSLNTSDLQSSLNQSTTETVARLKRKLSEREAESQHDQAIITKLKFSLETAEPSNKQARLELEKELQLCKQQLETKVERVTELQSQLRLIREEEKDVRFELTKCREQMELDCKNYQQQVKTLQQKCKQLQLDLDETKSSEKKIAQDLAAEIKRLQTEIKLNKKDAEQNKDQIQFLSKQVQNQAKGIRENEQLLIQNQKLQQRVMELENKIATDEDTNVIVRTKQAELMKLSEINNENAKLKEEIRLLRDSSKNSFLLQEQLHNVEHRLQYLKEKNASLQRIETEYETTKQKLGEWESLIADEDESNKQSPSFISKKLGQLQKNEAVLTDKVGSLTSTVHVLEACNQKLENKIASLTTELQHEKQRASDQSLLYRRLQKKVLLVSKDRDSYKRFASSYEEGRSNISAIQNEHIKSMESIAENYRNMVEQLEAQVEELQKLLAKQSSEPATETIIDATKKVKDKNEIEKLRNLVTSQQTQLQQYQKEKEQLERQLNEINTQQKADEGNTTFKVLHLKHNPLQIAIQQREAEYQKLKEENNKLHARIKILQETKDQEDITLRVQQHLLEQNPVTIESLKEQLETAEIRQKRLLEAAHKTGKDFREACYMLLGYKIDKPSQNKYKLSHMYAESPNDYLLFEYEKGQGVKLLETAYSANITELIDTYLTQYDSIPAFLSSLTMDLFSHQTLITQC